jgi:hypothetical protein
MKELAKNRTLIQTLRKFIKPDREKRGNKRYACVHIYISILQTDREIETKGGPAVSGI